MDRFGGLADGEWQKVDVVGIFDHSRAQGMGPAYEWVLGLRAGYVVAYGISVDELTFVSCGSRGEDRGRGQEVRACARALEVPSVFDRGCRRRDRSCV